MFEDFQVKLIEQVDRIIVHMTSENPLVTLFVILGYAMLVISAVFYLKEHFRFKTVVAAQLQIFRAIVSAGRRPK